MLSPTFWKTFPPETYVGLATPTSEDDGLVHGLPHFSKKKKKRKNRFSLFLCIKSRSALGWNPILVFPLSLPCFTSSFIFLHYIILIRILVPTSAHRYQEDLNFIAVKDENSIYLIDWILFLVLGLNLLVSKPYKKLELGCGKRVLLVHHRCIPVVESLTQHDFLMKIIINFTVTCKKYFYEA